jgi:hypothetical protein
MISVTARHALVSPHLPSLLQDASWVSPSLPSPSLPVTRCLFLRPLQSNLSHSANGVQKYDGLFVINLRISRINRGKEKHQLKTEGQDSQPDMRVNINFPCVHRHTQNHLSEFTHECRQDYKVLCVRSKKRFLSMLDRKIYILCIRLWCRLRLWYRGKAGALREGV